MLMELSKTQKLNLCFWEACKISPKKIFDQKKCQDFLPQKSMAQACADSPKSSKDMLLFL